MPPYRNRLNRELGPGQAETLTFVFQSNEDRHSQERPFESIELNPSISYERPHNAAPIQGKRTCSTQVTKPLETAAISRLSGSGQAAFRLGRAIVEPSIACSV